MMNCQLNNHVPQRNGWQNPQIAQMGLHYPVGPCRTQFQREQLPLVLRSLPELFRLLSLETMYQDSPVAVSCRSLDQVEFFVTMLESRSDPNYVILEVQRNSGDTIAFHRFARQILNVASCQSPTQNFVTARKPSLKSARLPDSKSLNAKDNSCVLGALEICSSMLSTDRYDAKRIGLQSLVHMTDPNKSGESAANTVAAFILNPTGTIQASVLKNLLGFACEDFDYGSRSTHGEGTTSDFPFLSLVVLSQVLRLAAENKALDMQKFLNQCPTHFLGCVLQKMLNARNQPHQAYVAVQCLTALCQFYPQVRQQIRSSDVEKVQHFGDSHHLALANASQKLLVALEV